ncbi:MAG: hypothetical protein ABL956_13630 [Hyphomonadaceae bacterium]
MRGIFLVGLVASLAAGPAFAQLVKGGPLMGVAELRAALFGIEMTGYSPTFGFAWRECIEPGGQTLYETPDGLMKGKLTISPKGAACFAYEDDGFATPACYRTRRTNAGFRFEGDFDSVFITTKVVKGIKSCRPSELVG